MKDCSTELAVRTCRFIAACSPSNRSMRSLTASPCKDGRTHARQNNIAKHLRISALSCKLGGGC